MNHGAFKDIAAGVQSIVVAVALVVGGLWSVFVLGDAARARAELEKIKHTEIALDMSISAHVIPRTSDDGRDIVVEVNIKNAGSKYIALDLRKPSLRLRKIGFDPNSGLRGEQTFVESHYYGPNVLPYQRINLVVGSSGTLPYLVRVPGPGVYILTFETPMAEDVARAVETLPLGTIDAQQPGPPVWAVQKIINVP